MPTDTRSPKIQVLHSQLMPFWAAMLLDQYVERTQESGNRKKSQSYYYEFHRKPAKIQAQRVKTDICPFTVSHDWENCWRCNHSTPATSTPNIKHVKPTIQSPGLISGVILGRRNISLGPCPHQHVVHQEPSTIGVQHTDFAIESPQPVHVRTQDDTDLSSSDSEYGLYFEEQVRPIYRHYSHQSPVCDLEARSLGGSSSRLLAQTAPPLPSHKTPTASHHLTAHASDTQRHQSRCDLQPNPPIQLIQHRHERQFSQRKHCQCHACINPRDASTDRRNAYCHVQTGSTVDTYTPRLRHRNPMQSQVRRQSYERPNINSETRRGLEVSDSRLVSSGVNGAANPCGWVQAHAMLWEGEDLRPGFQAYPCNNRIAIGKYDAKPASCISQSYNI